MFTSVSTQKLTFRLTPVAPTSLQVSIVLSVKAVMDSVGGKVAVKLQVVPRLVLITMILKFTESPTYSGLTNIFPGWHHFYLQCVENKKTLLCNSGEASDRTDQLSSPCNMWRLLLLQGSLLKEEISGQVGCLKVCTPSQEFNGTIVCHALSCPVMPSY